MESEHGKRNSSSATVRGIALDACILFWLLDRVVARSRSTLPRRLLARFRAFSRRRADKLTSPFPLVVKKKKYENGTNGNVFGETCGAVFRRRTSSSPSEYPHLPPIFFFFFSITRFEVHMPILAFPERLSGRNHRTRLPFGTCSCDLVHVVRILLPSIVRVYVFVVTDRDSCSRSSASHGAELVYGPGTMTSNVRQSSAAHSSCALSLSSLGGSLRCR